MKSCAVCSRRVPAREESGISGPEQVYCSDDCRWRAAYLRRKGLQPTGRWLKRTYTRRAA